MKNGGTSGLVMILYGETQKIKVVTQHVRYNPHEESFLI